MHPGRRTDGGVGVGLGIGNGCVYSVSPSGSAKEYSVNNLLAQDSAHAIAAGPDGNPWFIDRNDGNELGTVDRNTGYATITSLPNGANYGLALGEGPDRNLWVMDEDTNMYVYTPTPLSTSPTSVTLPDVGKSAKVTVTEPGTTRWTATSQDLSIATVKRGSAKNVFTVKAVSAGNTTVTIQDKIGNWVAVPVTVE